MPAPPSLAPGNRVTLCVWPEDVNGGGGTTQLRATVESSEFLGDTTRVHLQWGDRELLVTTDADLAGEVTVGFDLADVRVVESD